jgi:hypothetical protein
VELGIPDAEDRMVVAAREPALAVEEVVPLWAILEFELRLVEVVVVVRVNAVVELVDRDVDTVSSGVKTMKESRNKETERLSRLITVRVCCPLDSVGDLYASVVD